MKATINAGLASIKDNNIYLDDKRVELCKKVSFEMDADSVIPTVTIELIGQKVKIEEKEANIVIVVGDRKFKVIEEIK